MIIVVDQSLDRRTEEGERGNGNLTVEKTRSMLIQRKEKQEASPVIENQENCIEVKAAKVRVAQIDPGVKGPKHPHLLIRNRRQPVVNGFTTNFKKPWPLPLMIEQGQVPIKLMIVMILGRIGKRLEVKGVRKGIGQEGLDHDLKAKGEVEINEEEVQVTILTLVRTQGDEKVVEVKDQGKTFFGYIL